MPLGVKRQIPEPFNMVAVLKEPFTKQIPQQADIVTQTKHFCEYLNADGDRFYTSSTLRQSNTFICGHLLLTKASSKKARVGEQYIVAFSFKSCKLYLLNQEDQATQLQTSFYELEQVKDMKDGLSFLIRVA